MELKTQLATTPKQSEKLLELGIDPYTADCNYEIVDIDTYRLNVGEFIDQRTQLPAWSLQKLMHMLPSYIQEGDHTSFLEYEPDRGIFFYFGFELMDYSKYTLNEYDNIILLIEGLLKHNLVTKDNITSTSIEQGKPACRCTGCEFFDGYDMCLHHGNFGSITQQSLDKCKKHNLLREKLYGTT